MKKNEFNAMPNDRKSDTEMLFQSQQNDIRAINSVISS